MRAGIAGSGIMGSLLALALHNEGWQISLFEQSEGNDNCSLAAGGLLTPISELDKSSLVIFHLGQRSVKRCWPDILSQLPDTVYYRQSGSIILNHPNDQAEWNHFYQRVSEKLDHTKEIRFYRLSNDSLIRLEPDLAKFKTAYYCPDEAHIDCQALIPELHKYLARIGVTFFLNTPVLSLESGRIRTKDRRHDFDMVFDCRGLGARDVFPDLRALRGEIIRLYAPEVTLHRPVRFLHPRYSLYIVPRPGHIYLIGASEIEADDHSGISVRTTLELLTAAYYLHPGFAEARILKTVTHCRPTLANHLPRIKRSDGLIAVNGLYRHGYLIAPALAEEVLRGLSANVSLHYPEIWENDYDHHIPQ
ncbi:FAD-dependent oxidoreductase [Legionella spiritensis]|uniref:FAD-dependent oxidoreductase n=1 Tax=Legionella spiritensis TaxID=452 RepID=UPI000F847728|nr:FAD-dependent oxidoreductase [Legionella spiritensis]